MAASTQSRIYIGYVIVTNQGDYIGPFASEVRAQEYMRSFPADWKGEIKNLTLPHALRVYVETQY